MKTFTPLLVLWTLLPGCLNAQQLNGDWFGILETPEINMEVTLKLDYQGGVYNGLFVIALQGASLPVEDFQLKESILTFKIKQYEIQYDGVLESGNQAITGTFVQGSSKFPLNFFREKPEPPFGSVEWVKAVHENRSVHPHARRHAVVYLNLYPQRQQSRSLS
ncbi:MAG: hypothetical protein U0U46_13970 [Saprospiraceae bacterium]